MSGIVQLINTINEKTAVLNAGTAILERGILDYEQRKSRLKVVLKETLYKHVVIPYGTTGDIKESLDIAKAAKMLEMEGVIGGVENVVGVPIDPVYDDVTDHLLKSGVIDRVVKLEGVRMGDVTDEITPELRQKQARLFGVISKWFGKHGNIYRKFLKQEKAASAPGTGTFVTSNGPSYAMLHSVANGIPFFVADGYAVGNPAVAKVINERTGDALIPNDLVVDEKLTNTQRHAQAMIAFDKVFAYTHTGRVLKHGLLGLARFVLRSTVVSKLRREKTYDYSKVNGLVRLKGYDNVTPITFGGLVQSAPNDETHTIIAPGTGSSLVDADNPATLGALKFVNEKNYKPETSRDPRKNYATYSESIRNLIDTLYEEIEPEKIETSGQTGVFISGPTDSTGESYIKAMQSIIRASKKFGHKYLIPNDGSIPEEIVKAIQEHSENFHFTSFINLDALAADAGQNIAHVFHHGGTSTTMALKLNGMRTAGLVVLDEQYANAKSAFRSQINDALNATNGEFDEEVVNSIVQDISKQGSPSIEEIADTIIKKTASTNGVTLEKMALIKVLKENVLSAPPIYRDKVFNSGPENLFGIVRDLAKRVNPLSEDRVRSELQKALQELRIADDELVKHTLHFFMLRMADKHQQRRANQN